MTIHDTPPGTTGDPPPDGLPPEITTALDEIHRLVGVLHTFDLAATGRAAAESFLAGVLQEAHRLHAAVVHTVAGARDSHAFCDDGHRSVRAWVRWAGRLDDRDATLYAGAADAFDHLPAWRDAFDAGTVGIAQVREIVRLWNSPGVREALVEVEDRFVTLAQTRTYRELVDHCRRFALLASPADTDAAHQLAHERRDARLRPLPDAGFHLDAQHGPLQGAAMREIFDRFVADQYRQEADRTAAGEAARTAAHIRADALAELFRTAAGNPADGRRPEPLVSIVVTAAEFDAILTAAAADTSPRFDPTRFEIARLETRNGTVLSPRELLTAVAEGWTRRIVVDPAGHVIDLGHRQRLFTGAARDAALHAAARCTWAGGACTTSTPHLQVDHLHPAHAGGPTDQHNASPQCGYHNRYKERGYTVRRDPTTGRFVTFRRDGTPITPPPPPR